MVRLRTSADKPACRPMQLLILEMLVKQCRILFIFRWTLPIRSPELQHGAARSEVIHSKISSEHPFVKVLFPLQCYRVE